MRKRDRGPGPMGRSARSHLPGRRGFTLIEVVAALLIFTVAVLSVINLGITVRHQLQRISSTAHLNLVAHERVDSLRGVPYASLLPRTSVDTVAGETDSCRVTVAVSQWNPRLRRLDVTVTPLSRPGRDVALTAYRLDEW